MIPQYESDPEEIYRQSFEMIRREADLSTVVKALHPLILRLVHATGMPELVNDLAYSEGAAEAGTKALAEGGPILVDAEMVRHGIIAKNLRGNAVICTLNHEQVPALAEERKTTRSAAALELWRPHLKGAVVAIGNAPTALFRLLEMLEEGAEKPALILGFPVGFVGAAESKEALIAAAGEVPYVTLKGRLGGSAMAAAAVNALALETP